MFFSRSSATKMSAFPLFTLMGRSLYGLPAARLSFVLVTHAVQLLVEWTVKDAFEFQSFLDEEQIGDFIRLHQKPS